MWRGLVIGWLLGVSTFGVGVIASASWYEHRAITQTSDIELWIERDGCEVAGTDRIAYARCPRLRLP